jgi:hypothetical protein
VVVLIGLVLAVLAQLIKDLGGVMESPLLVLVELLVVVVLVHKA